MKKLPAWALLMIIAAVVGLLLGATNGVTLPIIESSARTEAEATRASLLPGSDSFQALTLDEGAALDNCYEAIKDGRVVGHVAQITVSGFGGPIEIMLGLDETRTVTGISVGGASFAETAGLGARTKEPAFTDQFAGLSTPVSLGTDVDAVTGATISSSAVTGGVNAIAEYVSSLG